MGFTTYPSCDTLTNIRWTVLPIDPQDVSKCCSILNLDGEFVRGEERKNREILKLANLSYVQVIFDIINFALILRQTI